MKILIANAGSTSLKYRLYEMPGELLLAEGRIENIEVNSQGEKKEGLSYAEAVHRIIETLTHPKFGALGTLRELSAVGFKVVHACQVTGCRILSDEVLSAMKEYIPVAPLHNKIYLDAIRLFRQELPDTPMIGLFESDFHKNMPAHASRYGIPTDWQEKYGIRRYGFHGASQRYLASRVEPLTGQPLKNQKVILCHLGGSSSIGALQEGISVETSMGFSPQSGVIQSSRVGELDAFALIYLLRKGVTVDEIEEGLIEQGGLKGISELSGDIPTLEKAASEGNEKARLALDVFVHDVRKMIGAYTAVLGGVDTVIFSGGIGERGVNIRKAVCEGFEYLGLKLDEGKNKEVDGEALISSEDSNVQIWVVQTNEELVVARECYGLLESN